VADIDTRSQWCDGKKAGALELLSCSQDDAMSPRTWGRQLDSASGRRWG